MPDDFAEWTDEQGPMYWVHVSDLDEALPKDLHPDDVVSFVPVVPLAGYERAEAERDRLREALERIERKGDGTWSADRCATEAEFVLRGVPDATDPRAGDSPA
jgi:hypothetical protein